MPAPEGPAGRGLAWLRVVEVGWDMVGWIMRKRKGEGSLWVFEILAHFVTSGGGGLYRAVQICIELFRVRNGYFYGTNMQGLGVGECGRLG